CCPTTTSPCTPPRAAARAPTRCSSPPCCARCSTATTCRRRWRARSSAGSWGSTTSPSSTCTTAGGPGRRGGRVERRELVVHYQPIIDLHNGRVAGAEALVRWPRPDRGLVPPAEVIPLAEGPGLVVELDRFVLRQACRQMAGWTAQAGPLLLHVNLSAHHLLRSDLAGNVAAALGDSGLAPECLALEITESVLMHDLEVAIVRLHELKRLGVHLAIDDFGTGYSSLAYLRQMPIDAV